MEKPRHALLAIVLLATAMFSAMGGPALAPALPSIRQAYASIPQIEFWVKVLITLPGFFGAIGAPLFGWCSDRWGRKPTLVLALGLWGLSGSSGLVPQPFWCLLAGRAVLGLSLGGLLAANTAIIADAFAADRQRRMMGLQSAFSSTGVLISLLLTGWLADAHWRLSFSVFLSAFLVLPCAFKLSLPHAHSMHKKSPIPAKTVFSSLFGVYAFGFMGMLAFTVVPTQVPFVIRNLGVRNASTTGLILAIVPLASALSGRMYARISKHAGLWSYYGVIGLVMLAGFYMLGMATHTFVLLAGLALVGMGYGQAMPHTNICLAHLTPPELRGRAMGLLTGCKFAGQFASPLLLQPLLVQWGYAGMLHISGWAILATAIAVASTGHFRSRQQH